MIYKHGTFYLIEDSRKGKGIRFSFAGERAHERETTGMIIGPLRDNKGWPAPPLFPSGMWVSYGRVIFSGRTNWSNSSPVRYPSLTAASRRLVCSTCAVCAIFAALS